MPAYVLNTCGTSLLTNSITNDFRKIINQYSNTISWDDIPQKVTEQLKAHIEERQQILLNADVHKICLMSAELNGLITWQIGRKFDLDKQDHYALLATDTVIGKSTAEMIQSWLTQQGYQTTIISAKGLNTSSLIDFREALSGLIKTLVNTLEGYKQSNYEVYFNLTGGFKSLNGFLQAVSTIYADKTFYLFEGSSELLFIPKLPLSLDAPKLVEDNLHAFRRLANDLTISSEEAEKIPDSLLFVIDDKVLLSEWGELLWQSGHKSIYEARLLPSISPTIRYGDKFSSSTKKLTAELMVLVNKRVAALANYTEHGCKHMLDSLDAKPMQAPNRKKVNMWECDLDAHHRIFMTKDGHNFTLDAVDKAIH